MSDIRKKTGPDYWGIDNDYGVLRDVLLGKPDYYRWVEAGPLIGRPPVEYTDVGQFSFITHRT